MLCGLFFARIYDYFCGILEYNYGIRQKTWLPYPMVYRDGRFTCDKSAVLCCLLWFGGVLYESDIL